MTSESLNPVIEAELDRLRQRGLGGPPPGEGSGGRGGDDNGGWKDELTDTTEQNPEKSRVVTAVLLVVVLMTFGGLIGAYIVIAANNVLEWTPFSLPFPVWISTFLIIASSITYHFGQRGVENRDLSTGRKYLTVTAALGGMFIASQLMAWVMLAARGLYVQGNPYAGFFYILTAIHAVHVLCGIAALGWVLLSAWYQSPGEDAMRYRQGLARSVGLYWHLMGGLWIVLFVLLGFWK